MHGLTLYWQPNSENEGSSGYVYENNGGHKTAVVFMAPSSRGSAAACGICDAIRAMATMRK
jgi:hypothetical protein